MYNGGPGSSTMWLRMGSFGPVRVLAGNGRPSGPPPYQIGNNPYSLLDKSDLVFIDMPDSGFGRILGGKEKEFFGVDQDVAAFGQFIQRYITTFHRWNSPKFLFGESYGTTRSAALSDYLLNHGIALNGVVLLSSILNFGLDYGNGEPNASGDWPYVLYLPTEAATAWYHNKVPNKPADLPSFLAQVEQFATGEYLDALYQGARLGASERANVARKLSEYLGVPQSYVLHSNLRIPYDRYQRELLRSDNVVVGRLDSRYTTYGLHTASNEGPPWDPTDSSIDAPYTTAVNAYLRDDLKYNTPLQYRPNIYGIIYSNGSSWDFTHNRRQPTNVATDLADAMTQNPGLKVFSANGYYDFATPFFATMYTLQHLQIAPELQNNITFGFYQSGHMVYLNDTALAQFKSDLSRWYDSALGR
jgi:carboxypeptidase C (cathepsin A)